MTQNTLHKCLQWCLLLGLQIILVDAQALTQDRINELREQLKDNIDQSNIGSGYAHMLNFFIDPDISSSYFKVDDGNDTEFNLYKLPLQKSFPLNDKGWKIITRGTLSYASVSQKAQILADETVRAKWKAYSGNIGTGIITPVYHGVSLFGGADLGISRLESKASYQSATLEDILAPIYDGIAYNWDTYAWIGGLMFGLDYFKSFNESYDLNVKGWYTYSYVSSFSESQDLPTFADSAGILALKADFTHPLGVSIADYPLYGVAQFGNTTFVGSNRDALGFTYFFEAGYSLKIDISRQQLPLGSLSLGYIWNRGDNVSGHTILLGWELATF